MSAASACDSENTMLRKEYDECLEKALPGAGIIRPYAGKPGTQLPDCEEHLLYFKRSLKVSAAYRAQHPDLLNTTLHIHVERRYGGRMPRQLQNQLGMFL